MARDGDCDWGIEGYTRHSYKAFAAMPTGRKVRWASVDARPQHGIQGEAPPSPAPSSDSPKPGGKSP